MHGCQGARAWAHLLAETLLLERLAQDAALRDDHHDAAREFLLELTHQPSLEAGVGQQTLVVLRQQAVRHLRTSAERSVFRKGRSIQAGQTLQRRRETHGDDDRLFVGGHLDLAGRGERQVAQVELEFRLSLKDGRKSPATRSKLTRGDAPG